MAKIGIQSVPSHLATALRTGVVLVFAWGMVFLVGSQGDLAQPHRGDLALTGAVGPDHRGLLAVLLPALQLGDVNKVTPIDKSSTVPHHPAGLACLLGEPLSLPQGLGVVAIGAGTLLMITRKEGRPGSPMTGAGSSMPWARRCLPALTALFGKLGVANIESNLATAIRTIVVLAMAWGMVFLTGGAEGPAPGGPAERDLPGALGAGHRGLLAVLFRALQAGPASVVVPIDKLSILVTILFSGLVLKETLNRKAALGLVADPGRHRGHAAMMPCPHGLCGGDFPPACIDGFSNTVLFSVSTFGSKILLFLLTPFYTSILTDAEYGVTDLIIQTGNVLIPLVSMGIINAVLRFGLDETTDLKGLFTTGLVVILVGGGGACPVLPPAPEHRPAVGLRPSAAALCPHGQPPRGSSAPWPRPWGRCGCTPAAASCAPPWWWR